MKKPKWSAKRKSHQLAEIYERNAVSRSNSIVSSRFSFYSQTLLDDEHHQNEAKNKKKNIMKKPRESRSSKQYENQHDLYNENLKPNKKRASLFLQATLADGNSNNILETMHLNHKFNYFSCFYGDESVIEQNIVRNFIIDSANDYTQNAMLSLGGNNNRVIVSFNTFKN